MPQDLKELPKYRPITGTVIVEASEWIEDNQWLLDLAKDDPFVVGIVGRLDPAAPVFVEQVRRFAKNPLYRGIRVWEDRVRGLLDRGELGSFREMAELGIAADLNGSPEVVPLASKLASLVPSLTIVLNHIGNVAVTKAPPPESWINAIRGAANHQNVYCKISALAEGASRDGNKAPAELDFYRPTIDVVWGAFGDDRVIYGSNWPVSELATDYRTVQKIALDYAFEKGEATAQKFCAGNAAKAYRWVNRPGRVPV